jgi:hypothetical protein
MLETYPINTPVLIGPVRYRTIAAVITAVIIRQHNVTYEVSYWDERQYKQVVLEDFEIDFGTATKTEIGFRQA